MSKHLLSTIITRDKHPSFRMSLRLPLLITASIAVLSLNSCQDRLSLDDGNEKFTVAQVKSIFESDLIGLQSTQTKTVLSGEKFGLCFNIGNIIPDWSSMDVNVSARIVSADIPASSTYRYRVFQKDPKTGKSQVVQCWHELLVLDACEPEKQSSFIVFYIPSNDYARRHRGDISEKFNGTGSMGDYSGLKLFCLLDGTLVRVNKYVDGSKTNGIKIPYGITVEEYVSRLASALHLLEGLTIQRGCRISTKGGKDRPSGGGNSGEQDGEWTYENYIDCGKGYFWDLENQELLFDTDGDGIPDSIVITESSIEVPYVEPDIEGEGVDDQTDSPGFGIDDEGSGKDGERGSGDGPKGAGTDVNQEISTDTSVSGFQITGTKEEIKKVKDRLESGRTIPILKKLLDNLRNKTINVSFKDNMGQNVALSEKGCIYINKDKLKELGFNQIAFYEEVFHIYQRDNDSVMAEKTGDLEFEAKVFDSILIKLHAIEDLSKQLDMEKVDIFMDYYNHPEDSDKLGKAEETMADLGYFENDFPTNAANKNNVDYRLHNLKSIIEN